MNIALGILIVSAIVLGLIVYTAPELSSEFED